MFYAEKMISIMGRNVALKSGKVFSKQYVLFSEPLINNTLFQMVLLF